MLVIGGCGELGSAIVRACSSSKYNFEAFATYHSKPPPEGEGKVRWVRLDCGDHGAVEGVLESVRPTAIIYAAVPNHGGAAGLGGAGVRKGIVDDVVFTARRSNQSNSVRFLAISTDQVFDGKSASLYSETSAKNPTNPYATYKSEMEDELLALKLPDLVICRTSLILTLDPPGKAISFVLSALKGQSQVTLYTDELRNMSWSGDLAQALLDLSFHEHSRQLKGIVHLAAGEITDRYHLALQLGQLYGMETDKVKPGLSALSGTNRPLDLSMDTTLLKQWLPQGTRLQGALQYLQQITSSKI
uniref:RmlD-like substrate binding domain-containing protein n=1 Tax=Arcella intermedia TaxID=1963864 RepID=A0A6B2LAZ2_9EUKA